MEFTFWQRFVAVLLAISLHAIVLISINYSKPEQDITGLEGVSISVVPMPSFVPEESTLTEETSIEEIETIELIEEVEEAEVVEVETIEEVESVEVVEIKQEKKAPAKKVVKQVKNLNSTEKTDSFHDKKPSLSRGTLSDTGVPKKVETSYKAIVSAILQKHRYYPPAALRKKQEGTVTVIFTIKKNGSLTEYQMTGSSGFQLLDKAVEKMLESATPFPPFPSDMKRESITLALPVDFYIKS
jgi:TonB family protein